MKNSYGDRVGQFVFTNTKFNGECWLNVYTGEILPRLPTQLEELLGTVSNVQVNVQVKKKPDIIQLVRYVRPVNPETFEVDNMQGTTFYIELDYNRKLVSFNYAMCKDENFCKALGIKIAKERFNEQKYQFRMHDDCISENGVLVDILENGNRWLHRTVIDHYIKAGYL